MEALIGLMLLVAFLGTLDFGAIFRHKNSYIPPAASETDWDQASLLQ
jgi:hypothetical protein